MLDGKQVELVKEDLKFSRRYLCAVVERLNRELEEKIKEDESLTDFSSNNWALLKAERLGYRRAIRNVINIIGPIEVKDD